MKAILMSIRKEHNDNIFSGRKKFEGRKTLPSNIEIRNYLDNTYDYSTASSSDVRIVVYEPKTGGGCGMVVGEFICDYAQSFRVQTADFNRIANALCVDKGFAEKYFNRPIGYMIRVCEPKRYDEPKPLTDFWRYNQCKEYDHFGICLHHEQCGIYDGGDCEMGHIRLRKPPQSWCYIER